MIMFKEIYEVEGEPEVLFGHRVRYFGIMESLEPCGFLGLQMRLEFTHRFFATEDGTCYKMEDGDWMVNTSRQFKEVIKNILPAKDEATYLKLIERSKPLKLGK